MPITPDLPFPKSAGDAIRSKDWNDLVVETQRLDNAKVNRSGDTISGNLSVSGSLGVKTATPRAPLHVVGAALISDANGYAIPNNHMQSGSLTIGSITQSFGGGTGWNANTAGLLLETLADTEIAVHDSGHRVASVVRYESATNSLTIGRDMGWGTINRVVINGNLGVGVAAPGFRMDVADRIRLRQGAGTAGMWLYQTTPAADRAFVGMNNDNLVGFWGNNGAQWALNMDVTSGNLGVRSNPGSNASLYVNGNSRTYGMFVTQADTWAIYATGDTFTSGRAIDNKIHTQNGATGAASTASTAWVDMPNMSVTINLPRSATILTLVQVNGVQTTGGTNIRGYFRILVDDVAVQLTAHEFNNNGWELRGVSMTDLRTLAAGSHVIKVQWYTTSGTLYSCWYGDRRHVQVIELS